MTLSIWATWLTFDDEDHKEGCLGADACRCGPIAYRRSHVIPADDDPRAGTVDVAAIGRFVLTDRQGGQERDEDFERVLPWLRLAVHTSTTVLDRVQVEQMHHTLGDWLARSRPDTTADSIPADIPAPSTKEGT